MFFPATLVVLARFRVRLQWRKEEGADDILCRQLPIVYHYGTLFVVDGSQGREEVKHERCMNVERLNH